MIADHFDLLQAGIKWHRNSTIKLYDLKKKSYKVIKWSNIDKSYSKTMFMECRGAIFALSHVSPTGSVTLLSPDLF